MTQPIEGHTVQRYDGELNHLHLLTLEMGGFVIEQLASALAVLAAKDIKLARNVIERDHHVNAMEVRADAEIVNVVTRRSPVARDLRAVMAISKTIADLERIGDESAKVAEISVAMFGGDNADPSKSLMRDIRVVGDIAASMLRKALTAFDQFDAGQAEEVLRMRADIDEEFQSALRRLATFIMEDARNVGHTINVVLVIKALERIGDYSRNIAESVIYLVKGDDVRHQVAEV